MSWANVLPWWVWELDHEEHIARMTGAMEGEWIPRYARAIPKHLYNHLKRIHDDAVL